MKIEKRIPFETPPWLPKSIYQEVEKIVNSGIDSDDLAVLERLATRIEMKNVFQILQKYLDDENIRKLFIKIWNWDAELPLDLNPYTRRSYREKLDSIKDALNLIITDIRVLSNNSVVLPHILSDPLFSVHHSCRDDFTKEKIEEISSDPLYSRNLPSLSDCLQSIAEIIQAESNNPPKFHSDQYTPSTIKRKGNRNYFLRQICMNNVGAIVRQYCKKGLDSTASTIVQILLDLTIAPDPSTVAKALKKTGK